MKTCIIAGAGGRGKDAYAPYIKEKGIMKIVGVAEPDRGKREQFCRDYDIAPDMCFDSLDTLFEHGRLADAIFICTSDTMHVKPALKAAELGYHIMLEKPISPSEEEVDELEAAMREYDKVFMTGFVLRHTPFVEKIKELIQDGAIGKIMTMQLNENEGYWHHAHSYVRGQWSSLKDAPPLIVSKSCHDFDLMRYIVDSKCTRVSSYGTNSYYISEMAPGDVPERCTDGCEYADSCMYNAVRLYTEGAASYFVHKFECGNKREDIIEALKTNPYGRCVYRCNSEVCDHQVASLEFENGATAVFTVSAFSLENTRTIKIMGTEGEIGGCMEDGIIVLKRFIDNSKTSIHIEHDGTRHCGGDGGLMEFFAKTISEESTSADLRVFEAHRMAFAAERSRLTGKSVEL